MGNIEFMGKSIAVAVVLDQERKESLRFISKALGPIHGLTNKAAVPELHNGDCTEICPHFYGCIIPAVFAAVHVIHPLVALHNRKGLQ